MKIVRRVLLAFALIGSFAMPIFFLVVRHYQMESETAEWIVSILPRPDMPLEDKRAVADMLVTYGEMAAENMLAYSAIGWCGWFGYRWLFRRAEAAEPLP